MYNFHLGACRLWEGVTSLEHTCPSVGWLVYLSQKRAGSSTSILLLPIVALVFPWITDIICDLLLQLVHATVLLEHFYLFECLLFAGTDLVSPDKSVLAERDEVLTNFQR